jgi:hypothetical protein
MAYGVDEVRLGNTYRHSRSYGFAEDLSSTLTGMILDDMLFGKFPLSKGNDITPEILEDLYDLPEHDIIDCSCGGILAKTQNRMFHCSGRYTQEFLDPFDVLIDWPDGTLTPRKKKYTGPELVQLNVRMYE